MAKKKILLLLLLAAGIVGWSLPADAQPPTPGEVREGLAPIPMIMEREEPPAIGLPEAAARPEPPPDERRIPLERFEFGGNTIFTDEELRAAVADWEGQDLTLTEIYHVSDLLTDYYQAAGYSLTVVTVPAQRMRHGVLRLEVVEGRTGQLHFEGNRRYRDEFLARRLAPVGPGTILRFKDLERQVLVINDLPGLLARSVLEPGEAYGTTDIHLAMEETRAEGRASLENYGGEAVGKWRALADLHLNNPLGYGDRLTLGVTQSEAGLLRQGRLAYGLPLNPAGTRLNFSYSRAEYDVAGLPAELVVDGVSETWRLQVDHPRLRSRRVNLNLTGGVARVRGVTDIDLLGTPETMRSDNAINVLEAGANYNRRHGDGARTTLSGQVTTNLQSDTSGADEDKMLLRLDLRGSHERPVGRTFSLLTRGELIYSPEPLPDSHKYGIGGPSSVRGFISSTERGDYGALASLELRRMQRFNRVDLIPRVFLDSAWVGRHSLPEVSGDSASLTSLGVGVTALAGEGRYMFDLQWAKPLDGKESGEGDSSRLWLTMSVGF